MWLMEERQKLETLGAAVKQMAEQIAALQASLVEIDKRLVMRKDQQVVLEARVDRIERSPSIQARRVIPSANLSSSAP